MSGLSRDGKLSYIQVPAVDARDSARFYAEVFGWSTRAGSADHVSFEDASGELIGAWVTGRQIITEPGVLPYIYVNAIDQVLEKITASGGEIVKPTFDEGGEGRLWVALFRDPAGNTMGLWKMGPRE
ncbi:MAG TPA: VOC family protein [Actinomycetota bacterium]|nr:VOC family protein [Actinomycetota bacterium]